MVLEFVETLEFLGQTISKKLAIRFDTTRFSENTIRCVNALMCERERERERVHQWREPSCQGGVEEAKERQHYHREQEEIGCLKQS
jgi:hypothetical protein